MIKEVPQNPGQEPKAVQMPPREEMFQRLQATGLYGLTPQTDAFYQRFIEQIADSEKVGVGLNVAWELASYDTLRPYPAVMRAVINSGFERVVDAVTPDPEVAEQAKEFRRRVLEEAERERKAKEPKTEDLGAEDSLQDFERFSQAVKVNEVMAEYTESRSQRSESLQDANNPYYRQTHRGFLLEEYYGSPHWLHTPWGEYCLGGEGDRFTGNKDEFLQRLGATVQKPVVNNEMGTIGPVYAVHKIDDVELPDPVERPRSAYKPYEEVDKAWNELAKKYYEAQGQAAPLTTLEKFALDDAIVEARGQNEPPVSEDDIKSLDQLGQYRGQVVKYTEDGGKTWHYSRLRQSEADYFSDGSFGYSADEEVLPNTEVHISIAFTDKRFSRGMVVRPATPEEVKDLKFSYNFSDEN